MDFRGHSGIIVWDDGFHNRYQMAYMIVYGMSGLNVSVNLSGTTEEYPPQAKNVCLRFFCVRKKFFKAKLKNGYANRKQSIGGREYEKVKKRDGTYRCS